MIWQIGALRMIYMNAEFTIYKYFDLTFCKYTSFPLINCPLTIHVGVHWIIIRRGYNCNCSHFCTPSNISLGKGFVSYKGKTTMPIICFDNKFLIQTLYINKLVSMMPLLGSWTNLVEIPMMPECKCHVVLW